MPSPSLAQQIDELVIKQIRTFKESATMDDEEILEYHLPHYHVAAWSVRVAAGLQAVFSVPTA
jgi:hypothetical protein